MSTIETRHFTIALTDQWSVFENAGQLVALGPDDSEVIVTSTIIEGQDVDNERQKALESSKRRILDLMSRNASHPQLIVNTELTQRTLVSGIELALLSCTGRDAEITFDQFLLSSDHELLFLTYEGPVTAHNTRDDVHRAIEASRLR